MWGCVYILREVGAHTSAWACLNSEAFGQLGTRRKHRSVLKAAQARAIRRSTLDEKLCDAHLLDKCPAGWWEACFRAAQGAPARWRCTHVVGFVCARSCLEQLGAMKRCSAANSVGFGTPMTKAQIPRRNAALCALLASTRLLPAARRVPWRWFRAIRSSARVPLLLQYALGRWGLARPDHRGRRRTDRS